MLPLHSCRIILYGELNHVPFQKLKNYIVLPREHALAHKDPLHLIDLKGTPLLELDSEECHCISRRMYNGPIISDHSSKNYREHGKIQQESEKETTP